MTAAIRVKGVSKEYRLGELQGYKTLRESLVGAVSLKGQRRNSSDGSSESDRIWALKDVTFEVEAGEVIGVVGHNGAGKTTLLKILSRITEPTAGEVELFGRVSSLLEVGTGFHPELTGRENIFLNGSILGMRRREITGKFDEIVEFSGVEKFLDTPVKRYSSGMQVRLAFAVAAHLDPEILLVDEVLAVGDAEFQRKCLGKMDDIAGGGRTIIFVSHNMAAIENLCAKCALIQSGRIQDIGPTAEVISTYLTGSHGKSGEFNLLDSGRVVYGSEHSLRLFRILNRDNEPISHIFIGEDVIFEISGFTNEARNNVILNIRINSSFGQRLAICNTSYQHPHNISLENKFIMRARVTNWRLMPGLYHVTLILADTNGLVDEVGPIAIEVVPKDVYKTGKVLPSRTGIYAPEVRWEIESDCR